MKAVHIHAEMQAKGDSVYRAGFFSVFNLTPHPVLYLDRPEALHSLLMLEMR